MTSNFTDRLQMKYGVVNLVRNRQSDFFRILEFVSVSDLLTIIRIWVNQFNTDRVRILTHDHKSDRPVLIEYVRLRIINGAHIVSVTILTESRHTLMTTIIWITQRTSFFDNFLSLSIFAVEVDWNVTFYSSIILWSVRDESSLWSLLFEMISSNSTIMSYGRSNMSLYISFL